MKPLRRWKLEGEALARVRPSEAKAARLQDRIAKLEDELFAAQGVMFEAIHRELKLPAGLNFELDATDPACFIIDEVPDICPGCREKHEGEQHQPTSIH